MFQRILLGILTVVVLSLVPSAFAGESEIATAYPSPHGEYLEVTASEVMTAPRKHVGDNTAGLKVGEIWEEM